MKRCRRLRRLVPDDELVRRRAAGEALRSLGADYGVAHTTLGRYFARPEIAKQLEAARRREHFERKAKRRASAAREADERRLEREVRREAKRQTALEQERRLTRARALVQAVPPRHLSAYELWLDARDARQSPTRRDLHTTSDEIATRAVEEGGGMRAVIEATGLRTRANVFHTIDPVIVVEALDNDAASTAVADPPRDRLRRLTPDVDLIRRHAAGEPLRRLAADYRVQHSTLYRYFRRPEIAKQLREVRQRSRKLPKRRVREQSRPVAGRR
jgi:hypothetical protein